MPPSWFPQNDREKLFELEGLRKKISPDLLKKGPRIKARAAIVYDLDRGEILYAKNPDERWPVASLTKVVSALTLASFEQDNLEEKTRRRYLYGSNTMMLFHRGYYKIPS